MNPMSLFPDVENKLDFAAKRQQSLAANIANVDTPGYRAKDVSFSSALEGAQLAVTSGQHIQEDGGSMHRVYEAGTPEKQNGNTVDLDREMSELSKNGLQYVTLIQYLNQKIRTLRAAINDGGR